MEKIKLFMESEKGKDVLTVLIVILVGFGSFELGRLSKDTGISDVEVQYPDQDTEGSVNQTANAVSAIESIKTEATSATSVQNPAPANKNYFASSRGSKYYTLGCSAGKSIKQENRVYFGTAEEAEKAGYTLSASCH